MSNISVKTPKLGKISKKILSNSIKVLQNTIPKSSLINWQHKLLFEPVIEQRGLSSNGKPPLFKVIFFELRTKCNGSCGFCPVNIYSDIREDVIMPFDLYQKAIDELKILGFSGRVAFYNNSDPLIVPEIHKYIQIATTNLDRAHTFHICTNGLGLTKEKGEAMLEAGANKFTVNDYTKDLKAPLPKKIIMFKKLVENFNKGKSKPTELIITRREINAILDNKSGEAPNKPEPALMDFRGFCLQPFTRFCIDPSGVVSLCCMDAFISKKMGDINKEKLIDIWEGETFNYFRKHLIEGDRKSLPVCSNCDYYGIAKHNGDKTVLQKFVQLLTT